MLKKRFLIVLLVVVLLMSTIVYSSNALTVQQLFPNYNVVSGTVISQTQLRGAPCASTTTNPVYFYSIHISSGTNVYVLEKDNGYYYIAYQNPSDNKYYTGYVPISNVSCSGASWCNYDVYWTAEAKTSYSSVICGPGAQTYFPVISVIHYNLPTESVDVTVLKTVGNFFFIQYRIQGQLVRGWVLQAAVTVYSANGSGKNNDYFAFVGQYKKCEYNERDSSENTVYIINCNTNLALTVNNTATGTIVTAEPFTGSLKQEFSIISQSYAYTLCKIYSQYADKVIELTDIVENGAFANVNTVSDPNKRQEYIFRIKDPNESPIQEKCIISTRGSGAHSALRLNSSNQLIATDCDNSSAFEWNICPKVWSGSMDYGVFNNGTLILNYSVDSIPQGYGIELNHINESVKYWNSTAFGDKIKLVEETTSSVDFTVEFINSADAHIQNSYAYTVFYGDINDFNYNTTRIPSVNNEDWVFAEIYIVYDTFSGLSLQNKINVITHEFGHALKFPHTAVNNVKQSALNTGNFNRFPDYISGSLQPAQYDVDRMSVKNYS